MEKAKVIELEPFLDRREMGLIDYHHDRGEISEARKILVRRIQRYERIKANEGLAQG